MKNQNTSHLDAEETRSDGLVSLESIFNAIKHKLKIKPGKIGQWLKPGLVSSKELFVTHKIQRDLSTQQINSYGQFNRMFARPIVVGVRPNGTLVCDDGQHTAILEMASCVGGELPEQLPAYFIDHPSDRSDEECEKIEAEVFYAYNSYRKDPSYVDRMKAGLAFELPEAVEYNKNLFKCGIYIEGYDYLGDPDGTPMEGEYQWRSAIKNFGIDIVKKSCETLAKLQEHENWKTPKGSKGKKEVLSIRADMVLMLSTLYDFVEKAKIDGKMKYKDISINNFIDNKLTEQVRKTWYGGISGASTGIIGALRIINEHNKYPQSTNIGTELLKKYGLVDPIVYKSK